MTRINLRLGQDLKDRVDDAARAAGISVNAWLVRAAAAALTDRPPAGSPTWTTARGSDHYRGWARLTPATPAHPTPVRSLRGALP